jgi:hypothetical protein
MTNGIGNPSEPPRYTGGQIAMTVFGVIMLLPGLCSLLFVVSMISELSFKEPMGSTIVTVWIICFAISAVGAALIYAARRGDRKAP